MWSIAQTGHEILTNQVGSNLNIQSPQGLSFTMHGNQKISMFTGQPEISIPLYSYQDPDFTIPLSIEYNMSGFMPNQKEGVVGLGWNLVAGGAVTRVVNGSPDDTEGTLGFNNYRPHGLYYGVKNNANYRGTTLQNIHNLSAGSISTNWYWNIDNCEVSPDLFSFSFPGFSGRFYIQNNGDIKCIGSKPFSVNLTNLRIQNMTGSLEDGVYDSEIVITTDDGYKFYFGGDISKLEVNYSLTNNKEVYDPVIIAWHITKIVAPNGREIIYKYVYFDTGIQPEDDPDDTKHYIYNINNIWMQEADSESNHPGTPCSSYATGGGSGLVTAYSTTKTIYLDSIIIGDKKINFDYVEKDKVFYPGYETHKFNQKGLKLQKIQIIDQSNYVIKDFAFSQAYLGATNSIMFLKSVKETGVNSYKFEYYGENTSFPNPLTAGVDHWGFWNNYTSAQGSSIPTFIYAENGDITISGTERNPNTSLCNIAMLKKIVYPTRGSTTYFYEPHSYSQRLERRNDNSFLAKLYSVLGNAGGTRVFKIVDNDSINDVSTREFKYVGNFPTGGVTSSGILMDWPRYAFFWKFINGEYSSNHLRVQSSSFNRNYNNGENYIQYSEVTEVQIAGGYTNYKFTDYVSNPDLSDYSTRILDNSVYPYITNVNLWNSYVGIKFNDKSFERGIPKKITQYKKDGSNYYIVHSTENTQFTGLSDFSNSYLVGVHGTGGIAQSYKIYYYPFLPKQTVEYTYNNAGTNPVSKTTNYAYNSSGYLTQKDYQTSDGATAMTKIRYTSDLINGIFPSMKNLNMLNFPIETITLKNNSIISGSLLTYKGGGGSYVPDKQYTLELSSPLLLSLFTNFDGSTKDSRYSSTPEIEFNDYTSKGRIKQITSKNGIITSYIWGYNELIPIVKADNVNYSTLSTAANSAAIAAGSTDINDLMQDIYKLYNTSEKDKWRNFNTTLRNNLGTSAFCATYAYDPLIGMISQSDPTSVITFYVYNLVGKLWYIKNDDEFFLKQYQIHYPAQ